MASCASSGTPYLLRGLIIDRPNQVWCADITYVPMAKGFMYLIAVMDWFSRRVLAWRVSITLEADFCVEALREAMQRHGQPEIFIKAYGSAREARVGIGGCGSRSTTTSGRTRRWAGTPRAVFEDTARNHVDNAAASLTRRPQQQKGIDQCRRVAILTIRHPIGSRGT
jgi:transposase InsO family protein